MNKGEGAILKRIFRYNAGAAGQKLTSLFCAAVLAVSIAGAPVSVSAQSMLSAADQEALTGATQTRLAYIKTGNRALDRMSEDGLFGLGLMLHKRANIGNLSVEKSEFGVGGNKTAVQQVMPVGVDPAKDNLVFFPVIYWAIDPGQPMISEEAIEALNRYMQTGGQIFIDTRDLATNNRGRAWLKRAEERGLHIPALQKVDGCEKLEASAVRGSGRKELPECHVLGKSFYLVNEFPGRYEGGNLWIEKTDSYRNDGVASVIIGGNEYAAAWAHDADERPLYPLIGNDPEQREKAIRVGINWVMHALTGNYKEDQVHIPAILERMKSRP